MVEVSSICLHAGLMIASWFIAIPAGVIVVRYFSHHTKVDYIELHQALQACAVLIVLLSTAIATTIKAPQRSDYQKGHVALGYITVAILSLQFLSGSSRLLVSSEFVVKKLPYIRKVCHWFLHGAVDNFVPFIALSKAILGTSIVKTFLEGGEMAILSL